MKNLDTNKLVDIVDICESLIEYKYLTLPQDDEDKINENIAKIHELIEEIDDLFDNSY